MWCPHELMPPNQRMTLKILGSPTANGRDSSTVNEFSPQYTLEQSTRANGPLILPNSHALRTGSSPPPSNMCNKFYSPLICDAYGQLNHAVPSLIRQQKLSLLSKCSVGYLILNRLPAARQNRKQFIQIRKTYAICS